MEIHTLIMVLMVPSPACFPGLPFSVLFRLQMGVCPLCLPQRDEMGAFHDSCLADCQQGSEVKYLLVIPGGD